MRVDVTESNKCGSKAEGGNKLTNSQTHKPIHDHENVYTGNKQKQNTNMNKTNKTNNSSTRHHLQHAALQTKSIVNVVSIYIH